MRERQHSGPLASTEAASTVPAVPEEFGGKMSLSIGQLCSATSFGKSLIYDEIKAGRLPLRRVGRRSVVLVTDALAWIRGETGSPARRDAR